MFLLGKNLGNSTYAQNKPATEKYKLSREKTLGLLLGSAIGDALGGPIEFQESDDVAPLVLNCRGWDDKRKLTQKDVEQFADSLELGAYGKLRPKPEPYGQWQPKAAAGTITDDTRHKMVLLNALNLADQEERFPISQSDLAEAYLTFSEEAPIASRPEYQELSEESLREYRKSANWIAGNHDLEIAAPPQRIWAGIPTCCGQMTLLPLAAIFPGQPGKAYQASYSLGFFDTGAAKDINSAIVAGLSVALQQIPPTGPPTSRQVWNSIAAAMNSTDPYRYAEIPFVVRPTTHWLEFAKNAVRRADRKPKVLYEILEREGQVKYYWESHFILSLVFAAIEFCDYDPLAAMALILDFGHDTDSGAQLLGAFLGAIYGPVLFPQKLQKPVITRLAEDYDVDLNQWTDLLQRLADREKYPEVVSLR